MTHHQHSFSVDASCDCGLMLSEYTRNLAKSNAALVAALEKFMSWLDQGLLVRDITKDAQPDWAMKMMHFVKDLSKIQATLAKAKGEGES